MNILTLRGFLLKYKFGRMLIIFEYIHRLRKSITFAVKNEKFAITCLRGVYVQSGEGVRRIACFFEFVKMTSSWQIDMVKIKIFSHIIHNIFILFNDINTIIALSFQVV